MILVDEDQLEDTDIPQKIFNWCESALQSPDTLQVIGIIASKLPALEAYYQSLKP